MPSTSKENSMAGTGSGGGGKRVDQPLEEPGVEDMADLPKMWPGGLPSDQLPLWAGMSQAHRRLATKRLAAILAYEAGGSRNASAHAVSAELSLDRFNAILGAWRRSRSLLALTPQARKRAARAFEPPEGIEDAAADAVRYGPDRSREQIAQSLYEAFGRRASITWIRRLVSRAHRDLERDRAGGSSGFGRRVVIDSTALPLPLLPVDWSDAMAADKRAEEIEYEWAVTALAWDSATGGILGYAVNRAPATLNLHAAAAKAAADRLRRMTTTADKGDEPVIVTTLPLAGANPLENIELMRQLTSEGAQVVAGPRAAGSELMKVFDGRIGRLDFRPRFAADGFDGRDTRAAALAKSDRSPMSLEDARLVVDFEIEAHNTIVMRGEVIPAVTPPIAADGLDRVFQRYLRD